MPAFAGEPVSARTSRGKATSETCEPSVETSCALQSRAKSRLRRSGTAIDRLYARWSGLLLVELGQLARQLGQARADLVGEDACAVGGRGHLRGELRALAREALGRVEDRRLDRDRGAGDERQGQGVARTGVDLGAVGEH